MPRKEREAFHMPFVAGVGTDIPLRPDLMDIGYGNMDDKGRSMFCMRRCGWGTTSIKRQMAIWGATEKEIEENVPVSEELERTIREQLKEQLLADPDAGICILTAENPFPYVSHQHYEDGVITRRSVLGWGMPLSLLLSVRAWFRKSRRGWNNQNDRDRRGRVLVAKMAAFCPWRIVYFLDLKPEDESLAGA